MRSLNGALDVRVISKGLIGVIVLLPVLVNAQCLEPAYVRIFGSAEIDAGHAIDVTDAGIYALGVTTWQGAGSRDLLLVHTGMDFQPLWSVTIGTAIDENGSNALVKVLNDGSIAFAAFTFGSGTRDMVMGRLSSSGELLWSLVRWSSADDTPRDLIQLANGDLLLCGTVTSLGFGGSDAFLVRMSLEGEVLWARNYGGGANDHFYSLKELPGGTILCAGNNASWTASPAGWVVRTNPDGMIMAQTLLDGSGVDTFMGADAAADGSIYLNMRSQTYDDGGDMLMVKMDQDLNLQWQWRVVSDQSIDWGTEVHCTPVGILFSGNTEVDGTNAMLNIMLNASGIITGSSYLNFAGADSFELVSRITDWHNGVYHGIFTSNSFGSNSNLGLVRFDGCGPMDCTVDALPVLLSASLVSGSLSAETADFAGFVPWNPVVEPVDIGGFFVAEPCGTFCHTEVGPGTMLLCQGEPGLLEAAVTSDSEVIQATWQLEDGTSLSGLSAEVTFADTGVFEVLFSVETLNPLCDLQDVFTVAVEPASICSDNCITTLDLAIPTFCAGESDTLLATVTVGGAAVPVSWQFADGTVLTGNEVVTSFDQSGILEVVLVAEAANPACNTSEPYLIVVQEEGACVPVCSLSVEVPDLILCEGVTDTLTAVVVADPAVENITWTLPGGIVYEGNDAEVLVAGAGTMPLLLEVSTADPACAFAGVFDLVVIECGPACDLSLVLLMAESACVGEEVTASVTAVGNSPVETIEWALGEGTVLTGYEAVFAFAEAGTVAVAVSALSEWPGCSADTVASVEVLGLPLLLEAEDVVLCTGEAYIPEPGHGLFNLDGLPADGTVTGQYLLQVENLCGVSRDTIFIAVSNTQWPALQSSYSLCTGDTVFLPEPSGQWTYAVNGVAFSGAAALSEPGTYTVTITDVFGCSLQQPVSVTPQANESPGSRLFCLETWPELLDELSLNYPGAVWLDDAMNEPGWSGAAGTYLLQALAPCPDVPVPVALVADPACSCETWIPNSFTPDNDGINDVWLPVWAAPPFEYDLFIADRWGREVFSSRDPVEEWLGNTAGGAHYVQPGVYVYRLQYRCSPGGVPRLLTGHVTVVR